MKVYHMRNSVIWHMSVIFYISDFIASSLIRWKTGDLLLWMLSCDLGIYRDISDLLQHQ